MSNMEDYQRRKHPLEQAAIINAVSLNNAVSFCTKGVDDTLNVLRIAEIFRKWLNTVSQEPVDMSNEASKVLDEIVKRCGKPRSEVYPAVLDWVKQTYDADWYPQQMSSVAPFLTWAGWD